MAREGAKVFLDSNVILSGLLSDKGPPRIILDVLTLRLPQLKGMTGEYNITEIERNLGKKLPAALPVYRKYLPLLHLEIIPLPSHQEVEEVSEWIDRKDAPVLASALKGNADFLVTGDKKDFGRVGRMKGISLTIVSPAEFLERMVCEMLEE